MGFEAKINIVAEAKINKFSTASRNAKNNIEGLDIGNSAAGLIALISLIILPDLMLPGRKVVVIAIRFSYFFYKFLSFF